MTTTVLKHTLNELTKAENDIDKKLNELSLKATEVWAIKTIGKEILTAGEILK